MAKRRVEYVLDAEDRASPLIQKSSQKMERQLRGTSKRVESSFQRMTTSAQRFAGAVGLGGIGIAAGAALAVRSLRQQFQELDDLAKQARGMGVAADQLQLMRFAGEQTGTEINALDKSIERFTRRLGQATEGEGEARKGLAELRLEADDLVRLPLAERMVAVADAMENRGLNATDRLRVSFALFGREGQKLGNTLLANRDALDALFEERRELGGLFDEEELARIEKANDEWNKMGVALEGLTAQLGVLVAGPLARYVEGVQEAVASLEKARDLSAEERIGQRGGARLPLPGAFGGVGNLDFFSRLRDVGQNVSDLIELRTRRSLPGISGPTLPPEELARLGRLTQSRSGPQRARVNPDTVLDQLLGLGFATRGGSLTPGNRLTPTTRLGTRGLVDPDEVIDRLFGIGFASSAAPGRPLLNPEDRLTPTTRLGVSGPVDPDATIASLRALGLIKGPAGAAAVEADETGRGLRAVESRFLTRGREAVDPEKKTADNTGETVKILSRMERRAKEQTDRLVDTLERFGLVPETVGAS